MRLRNLLALICLFIYSAGTGMAQTTFASITGTVTDSSGAALPGAVVEVTRVERNYHYTVKTNEIGLYTVPNLLEGTYTLRVSAAGFEGFVVNNIQLVARDVRRIDVKMTVGQVLVQVKVKAGAALIETETARISQSRTAEELRDLPLNTRSVTSFLSLVPGVGQATTVTATYRFNGSRRNQSEFTIDGISNVTSNGTQTSPLTNYIESFQELRVDSAGNAADAGAVGQVTVISKSGTRAYDFFATDEWKLSPKLTLNLGLRYELHPAWGSGNGLASLFDLKTGQIVVQDGSLNKVSPLMPLNYVNVVSASQAGYSGSALINTDKNNFAPRLGVAWRPWGDKTVFRAGFGIFYDIVPTSINVAGVPFSVNEPSFTNPAVNPTVVLPVVFPSSVAGPATVSLPGAFKKDLRIPYTIQYNLTIEREVAKTGVRISYVGTGTRQGEYVYNVNQPAASTVLYINKPRPFPKYPGINYTTNGATHQYNGLNVEVKRRLAGGLLYDFTWTWARDIGDLERDQVPENSYDLHRERAVWADIPTHRVTADFIYQLPFGNGKKWPAHSSRWANVIAGGWETKGLVAMNTGFSLTPYWQGPDPTNTANTTSSTPPTVTIRPNVLHDPNLPPGQRSVSRWFDVSAFGPPTPGSFGTSAKGVIVGPGSFIIDAGFAKNFSLSERFHLRLELTGTNVLNHPNWDISPAAGTLTSPGLTISNLNTAKDHGYWWQRRGRA